MTLTPEERQKIYEEEKARLEAKRELTDEKMSENLKSPALKWALIIAAIFLGLFLFDKIERFLMGL